MNESQRATDEKRKGFMDACKPYCAVGLEGHFIRGYDDHQCGRPHAFVGATVAGDAYRSGWNTYKMHRTGAYEV